MDMTNKLRNNFWNIRALAAWKNFVRYSDHDPNKDIFKSTCELIIKCKILMIQAMSVSKTRKKIEFYTLKKFYKANLEIQYKHNVNVIVSDAIYAPKNKEVTDVMSYETHNRKIYLEPNPKRKRFYANYNKEINGEPNPTNVTFNSIYRQKAKDTLDDIETSEDIFEYNDIKRATGDLRSTNNDILIDDREPSEDYINVTNVREPREDITVTKDKVPYRQDKATNKQIYIDPKQGKKNSKKGKDKLLSLNILSMNCRSINNKKPSIKEILESQNIDIAICSELNL
jgi:hypothetical protein